MISQEMPFCCGISILANFPFPSNSKKENKNRVKEVTNFLREAEYELIYRKGHTASMMQANLNGRQMNLLREVFEEAGWTTPESFFHASHSSQIFVLTKALYPEGIETKAPARYDKFLKNKMKQITIQNRAACQAGPPGPTIGALTEDPPQRGNYLWRRMLENL